MKAAKSKFKYGAFGTACAMLALPVASHAGDGPYIGLEGGANWEQPQSINNSTTGDTVGSLKFDHPFDTGYIGGLTLGYGLPFGLRPELELDYRRNDIKTVNAVGFPPTEVGGFENAYTAMGNLWYDFKLPTGFFSVVHPYVGGGAGAARVAIRHYDGPVLDGSDFSTKFAFQGGAGVGFDVTPNLTISADYRYLQAAHGSYNLGGADFDARYRSQSALIGVRYSFGSPPPPAPTPVALPPPPPPRPVALPPPPCTDSDGDGVCDAVDKCPGTPHGFKVDASGCIVEQTVILRAVNFEFNKDVLTEPAMQTLDEVASALEGQPNLNVQIGGYTDSVGSASYNLKLSKKRAESVRRYLVSKGVSGTNLVAKGFGKADPVASNDTEDGRAENRRVEFVVLNKPATVNVVDKGSTQASKAAAEGSEPAHVKHKRHKKPAAPATTPAPAGGDAPQQ